MADASTIASLATAGGTLVLALATFSSTRSANRAARVSELALQARLRPVLFSARYDDTAQKVSWIDNYHVVLRNGLAVVHEEQEAMYMAIPLRNVGSGLAVLHAWNIYAGPASIEPPSDIDSFRRQQVDLYVPAGDVGFWQGALRDNDDPLREQLRAAIDAAGPITVELLYGDHEGGQRTVTSFNLTSREGAPGESWERTTRPVRHWNIDREQPR